MVTNANEETDYAQREEDPTVAVSKEEENHSPLIAVPGHRNNKEGEKGLGSSFLGRHFRKKETNLDRHDQGGG